MKFILFTIAFVAIFVLSIYAVWGRTWLKTKPWAAGFFAWIEPIEIAVFKKSETILWARIKMGTGVLLSLLTQFSDFNLTPLLPFFPERWNGIIVTVVNFLPLAITIVGWLDEKLRYTSTKPIELVAVPDKEVEANPVLASAIAAADEAKVIAVETVKVEAS